MRGILIDVSKCIGCGACREACRTKNNLPESNDTDLSAKTYTVVKTAGQANYRRMCMHCLDPTCVSVCPVGAFRKTAGGPVIYAAEKCMGCRYCMVACPFGVPRYEWDKPLPLVQKCNMCADRVGDGGVPACAEACPTGATAFGERTELIREARARIVAEPGKYINRVYGRDEVGGTSVLYLSTVPFEQLGLPTNLDQKPLPLLTFRVLSKIPHLVALGGVALGGIWWITNRREEVARAENGGKTRNGKGGGR